MKNNLIYALLLCSIAILLSCSEEKYVQGQRIYEYHCGNCHMNDGTGLVKVYPPLKNSDYLYNNIDNLPCIIKNGISGEIVVNGITYNEAMLGYPDLSDAEISNLTNYIISKWANSNDPFTFKKIKSSLEKCQK